MNGLERASSSRECSCLGVGAFGPTRPGRSTVQAVDRHGEVGAGLEELKIIQPVEQAKQMGTDLVGRGGLRIFGVWGDLGHATPMNAYLSTAKLTLADNGVNLNHADGDRTY